MNTQAPITAISVEHGTVTLSRDTAYDIIHDNLPQYMDDCAVGFIIGTDEGKELTIELRSMDSEEAPVDTLDFKAEVLDYYTNPRYKELKMEAPEGRDRMVQALRDLADELEAA